MAKKFPGTVSQEPRVSHQLDVDNNDSEAIRNLREMIAAVLRTAPWLTVEQATARCEAARRAVQEASAKMRRRA
jgi:hypothetical protein